MNKKIAIILALMITSTTTLFGCNSTTKTDSKSNSDSTAQVSSVEEENAETNSNDNLEENKTDKNESTKDNNTASTNNKNADTNSNKNTQSKQSTSNKNNNASNSSSNSANKTEVKKPSNTTASSKNEQPSAPKKATTFTAKAGYTLTFPANWEGKYIVEDNGDVLNVKYKSSKDKTYPNPLFFTIEIENPDRDYDYFDRVGNIRTFNVGDKKYYIGGPTDVGLSEQSADFNDFIQMSREKAEVANSLKVIK